MILYNKESLIKDDENDSHSAHKYKSSRYHSYFNR